MRHAVFTQRVTKYQHRALDCCRRLQPDQPNLKLTEAVTIARFLKRVNNKIVARGKVCCRLGIRWTPMISYISGEFAKHLSSKNYIIADLSLGLKSSNGHAPE